MNNPIVRILRFLLFIPICYIILAIVYWGLAYLLIWFLGLSKFWFFIFIVFLGGFFWGLFKLFATLLSMLALYISPIKWLSIATISILTLINTGKISYILWTYKDAYLGWEKFRAIIGILLVLELTFGLILGSFEANKEQY